MRIVITGVPGTGKSAIAAKLARKLRCELVRVNELVEEKRLWQGKDKFGSKIVEMGRLRKELVRRLAGERDLILEGHLACEFRLPADLIVVCRTDPDLLAKRLARRGYPREKIEENVMAEMLDYCTVLSLENHGKKAVYEIETGKNIAKNLAEISSIMAGKGTKLKAGWVSWSKKLEKKIASRQSGPASSGFSKRATRF